MIASRRVYIVRHSRGSCIIYPTAISGSAHTGKQAKQVNAVVHMQESTHNVPKSASQAVLSRMQLTLHATRRSPHGASCLAQAMLAWSVKTRHAPSRHCRDTRVYGQTTTAMHDNEYTSPSPPFQPNGVIGKTRPRKALLRASTCPKFSSDALSMPRTHPPFFFYFRAHCWG